MILQLTRNGQPVDMAAEHVTVESLTQSYRGEGARLVCRLAADWHLGTSWKLDDRLELRRGGTLLFLGWITRIEQAGGRADVVTVEAADPFIRCRQITARDTSGVPRLAWNVPRDDPDYTPARENMTAGQIIDELLSLHAGPLGFLGISSTAVGTSDLLWVPRELRIQDTDLVGAIEDIVRTIDGVLYWYDPATPAWQFALARSPRAYVTVTLGSDSVVRDVVHVDSEGSYTAVRIVGQRQTDPVWLRLSDGTLLKDWDESLESSWKWEHAFSLVAVKGTPTSWTQTSLTDTSQTWTPDEWKDGSVRLVDGSKTPPVALLRTVAGNSSNTLSWLVPLNMDNVTEYELVRHGMGAAQYVWRRFTPARQEDKKLAWISDELITVPVGVTGVLYQSGRHPLLIVEHSTATGKVYMPVPIVVDPGGEILAAYPVVQLTSTPAQLNTAGGAVPPDDVHFIGPVYREPLQVSYPPGGTPTAWGANYVDDDANWTLNEWAGMTIEITGDGQLHVATVTGNTANRITFDPPHSFTSVDEYQVHGGGALQDGIRRTMTVYVPEYRTRAYESTFRDAAKLVWESRSVAARTVTLPLAGFVAPLGGHALRLAAVGATTGLETADIPVQAVRYQWGGNPPEVTTITASHDTRAWAGLRQWVDILTGLPVVPVFGIGEAVELEWNPWTPVRDVMGAITGAALEPLDVAITAAAPGRVDGSVMDAVAAIMGAMI